MKAQKIVRMDILNSSIRLKISLALVVAIFMTVRFTALTEDIKFIQESFKKISKTHAFFY